MKLYPMPGTVILEYLEPVERRSEIVLPTSFPREERRTGRIAAVGDPKSVYSDTLERFVQAPITVKVGQYVVFKRHAADIFTIAGRQFFSVDVNDLLLVTDDQKEFESITVTDQ